MERLYRGQSRKKGGIARLVLVALIFSITVACDPASEPTREKLSETPDQTAPSARVATEKTPKPKDPSNKWVTEPPDWLGERVLPMGPNGMGVAKPTPPILRNRRFPTIDILPRPTRPGYHATIQPIPRQVLERSTWRSKCPVAPEELAYLTLTFWGFDRERHTGEMIVNASVAEDVVDAFRGVYRSRLAIEEMRVATLAEQRAWNRAPTGDTNVTSSFECRQATGGSNWSEHAYGLAIDINPFHNPYLLGDIVGPELAGAYTDRTWKRPGMIFEGDAVVQSFDAIGWGWGGRWNSLKDWMHFSLNGH